MDDVKNGLERYLEATVEDSPFIQRKDINVPTVKRGRWGRNRMQQMQWDKRLFPISFTCASRHLLSQLALAARGV